MQRGKLIVIVAPSGTGKSTLISKLMHEVKELEWSVSCTTRPIRRGEVNGVDYHFLGEEEFLERKDNNEFIEWAKVHSNYYGTLKKFVDQGLEEGKNLLFDLDVQGCDQMKKIYGDEANVIFIEPPSYEELCRRLKLRGTDSEEVIQERLSNAKSELSRKDDFDYLVTNDDIEKAVGALKKVVGEILRK
ncbi:MAG: guanylate kinase [Halobacteriovoraceae bacterium]|nr:guanylate kinase [Halobacteriovoraceae bacterium]